MGDNLTEAGDRIRAEESKGEARTGELCGGAFSLLLDISARCLMDLVVLLI